MFTPHMVRRLGVDRNRMRPVSDRIERWLAAALLLAFVVAAPLLSDRSARTVYRTDLRQQVWDQQHLRRVRAVLLTDGTPPSAGYTGAGAEPRQVRASWTAPDGSPRTGTVRVTDGAAGDRVAIWVDDRGRPSEPPVGSTPTTDAVVAAVAAALGLALGLALIRWTVRRLLERHRLRGWQAEWLEVGPRWTRRR